MVVIPEPIWRNETASLMTTASFPVPISVTRVRRAARKKETDLAEHPFGVPPRRLFHQRAAQLDRITLHLVVRQHDIKSLLNKRLSRAERKLSDTYFSFVDMIAS
jgi:hypothetical protein